LAILHYPESCDMKILMIGGKQLEAGFRAAGHQTRSIVQSKDADHSDDIQCEFYEKPGVVKNCIRDTIASFQPDMIFQGDHSGPLLHTGLEEVGLPKVWYAVDAHLHGDWYRNYALVFDRVYCAQQNQVNLLSTWHPDVQWLPLYCSEAVEPLPWNKRDIPISFVGKIESRLNPVRKQFFDALNDLGIEVHTATGKWAPVYCRSKIVINNAVNDDLNLRFFEATGSGALLVTDELTHSMSDILIPGEDYLTYRHGDGASCKERIDWAFSHDAQAAEMAKRAYEKISSAHREEHRAAEVLSWFEAHKTKKKFFLHEQVHEHVAWAYDRVAQLDYPASLVAFFREESLRHAAVALQGRNTAGYATTLLADNALQNKDYTAAADYIALSEQHKVADVELDKRILKIRIVVEVAQGNRQRARHLSSLAMRRFGDDNEICALANMIAKMGSP
jgi:hypothetical protein